MTLDDVFGSLHALAGRWQGDASKRKSLWRDDPIAATLSLAAAELKEELTRLTHETARVTVAEFAQVRGVSPQCVRRWIRDGYLQASKTRDGYSIARSARVVRKTAA